MARTRVYNTHDNHLPADTTTVLHTGPCKIRLIILNSSESATAQVSIWDHETGGVNDLLFINVETATSPVVITFPEHFPLKCDTGLTVYCPSGVTGLIVTEA